MGKDDLNEAIAMHACGYMTIKDAAWVLHRYRRQAGRPLRAADLMETFGASRTAAYRAVSDLRMALAGAATRVEAARESGRETHQDVPESGNPGIPDCGTGRIRESRSPGIPESRIAGQIVPECGTPSPGMRDSNTDERSGGLREGGVGRARAYAREGDSGRAPGPDPDDEAERQAIRDLAAEVSGGALGYWASGALKVYEPHHVRALVETKIAGIRPIPKAEWLNAILRRWARGEGGDIPPHPSEQHDPPAVVPMRATGTGHRPPPRRPTAAEARQAAMDAIDGMDFGD